jgi:hypothetical protein
VPPAAVGRADAAVRWRISAGLIDNIFVYCVYAVLCAVFGWRVGSVDHLWLVALFMSAVSIFGIAHAGDRQLTASYRAAFMAGCERSATASPSTCECILTRLEAEGYDTTNAQRQLFAHLREDAASGTLSPDSRDMLAAVNACRT